MKFKILDLFCGAGGFSAGLDMVDNFTTEVGLVVNENEFIVLNMYDILPFPGINVFEEYIDKIEEYDKIIVQLANYANKLVYKTKNRFTNLEIEIMVTR